MAYYYRLEDSEMNDCINSSLSEKGLSLFSNPKLNSESGPFLNYDFSRHVLIEFLDDFTPVKKLWESLGFIRNKDIVRKRIMVDPHRLKCRRAIVICSNSESARCIANHLKGKMVIERHICAVVIEDLLADIRLFEKQIKKYGDLKSQQKLVYVSNLSKCREPAGLVSFLNEKFSPFGTILSILVSEDAKGYAFGEAVIRFSYFSEAFAAELAYDEFVLGKERLHVAMQHNILLCECDLRVRLRDVLKSYQNKIAAVSSVRPSVSSSAKSDSSVKNKEHATHANSLGAKNVKVYPVGNRTQSEIQPPSQTNACVQLPNVGGVNVELVKKMLAEQSVGSTIANIDKILTALPKFRPLCDEKAHEKVAEFAFQCCKEKCSANLSHPFGDSSNIIQTTESYDADNELSENSSQSWSSRIFEWMRSFVTKESSEVLHNNNQRNEHGSLPFSDFHVNVAESVVPKGLYSRRFFQPLVSNINNASGKNSIDSSSDNVKVVSDVLQVLDNASTYNEHSHGSATMSSHSKAEGLHDNVKNCLHPKNHKNFGVTSDKLTANSHKENARPILKTSKTKKLIIGRSSNRKNHTENSFSSVHINNRYNIKTRSKAKQLGLSDTSSQRADISELNNLSVDVLNVSSALSQERKKPQSHTFPVLHDCQGAVINAKQIIPMPVLTDFPTRLSLLSEAKKNSSMLEHCLTASAEKKSVLLHSFLKGSESEVLMKATESFDCSDVFLHFNSDSADNPIGSSTQLSCTEVSKNFRYEKSSSMHSFSLDNELEHENVISECPNMCRAKLSPAVISSRLEQSHVSVPVSSRECKSDSTCISDSMNSPIQAWLKKHLFYSVNNRVMSNEENPEAIVFATMSKDVLISVGCSHMTCDVCYPGALNLIFGL